VDRFEPNLRIPGPTALPPSVRTAGARQMINHRGPEFAAMLDRILTGMKPFFGTTSDVAMLTTAGSGGLEAAVVNTLSPGDRVLGVSIGSFGDRFAKIAGIYGADVTKLDVEWGHAADPAAVRDALAANPGWKAVLLTHNETSTGVMNPIPALAAAVHEAAPDALILVDSVSGLGAVPFEMDAWGVDLVVTGSQKAWMSAPGLAMIAASPRAWTAMETATAPRVYLDLRAHRGVHPRVGAVDVVPFIPLDGSTMADAVEAARRLGEAVAERFALPVYLYEEAAARPERRALPDVRRGGFEGFPAKMADPAWAPDFGPGHVHPAAGVTIVGARFFLIAFNLILDAPDVAVARAIAREVRAASGGLPAVRALGVYLESRGRAQVSLNLLDYRQTSVWAAMAAVERAAAARGARVEETELIGLMPEAAALEVVSEALKLPGFDSGKILEETR